MTEVVKVIDLTSGDNDGILMSIMIQTIVSTIQSALYAQIIVAVILIALASLIIQPFVMLLIKRLTAKTKTDLDDAIIAIIDKPIFYSVIVTGFILSAHMIVFPHYVTVFADRFLRTVLIFIWTSALIKIVKLLNARFAKSRKKTFINTQTLPLFDNLAFILIAAGSVYAIFSVWGINMTAWLASAGVVGMAVGFAAKDTLANLITGVFILTDKPYKIGDFVVLDGGERGQVTRVGVRSTRILTRSDSEIIIPNAVMGGAKIINETGGPYKKFRVEVQVGVSYDSDIEKVEKVLLDIAKKEALVCDEPEPRVRFRAFGDSALDFSLYCWVEEPVLRGKAIHFLNKQVYLQFKKHNIEIPFPQLDVHTKK